MGAGRNRSQQGNDDEHRKTQENLDGDVAQQPIDRGRTICRFGREHGSQSSAIDRRNGHHHEKAADLEQQQPAVWCPDQCRDRAHEEPRADDAGDQQGAHACDPASGKAGPCCVARSPWTFRRPARGRRAEAARAERDRRSRPPRRRDAAHRRRNAAAPNSPATPRRVRRRPGCRAGPRQGRRGANSPRGAAAVRCSIHRRAAPATRQAPHARTRSSRSGSR